MPDELMPDELKLRGADGKLYKLTPPDTSNRQIEPLRTPKAESILRTAKQLQLRQDFAPRDLIDWGRSQNLSEAEARWFAREYLKGSSGNAYWDAMVRPETLNPAFDSLLSKRNVNLIEGLGNILSTPQRSLTSMVLTAGKREFGKESNAAATASSFADAYAADPEWGSVFEGYAPWLPKPLRRAAAIPADIALDPLNMLIGMGLIGQSARQASKVPKATKAAAAVEAKASQAAAKSSTGLKRTVAKAIEKSAKTAQKDLKPLDFMDNNASQNWSAWFGIDPAKAVHSDSPFRLAGLFGHLVLDAPAATAAVKSASGAKAGERLSTAFAHLAQVADLRRNMAQVDPLTHAKEISAAERRSRHVPTSTYDSAKRYVDSLPVDHPDRLAFDHVSASQKASATGYAYTKARDVEEMYRMAELGGWKPASGTTGAVKSSFEEPVVGYLRTGTDAESKLIRDLEGNLELRYQQLRRAGGTIDADSLGDLFGDSWRGADADAAADAFTEYATRRRLSEASKSSQDNLFQLQDRATQSNAAANAHAIYRTDLSDSAKAAALIDHALANGKRVEVTIAQGTSNRFLMRKYADNPHVRFVSAPVESGYKPRSKPNPSAYFRIGGLSAAGRREMERQLRNVNSSLYTDALSLWKASKTVLNPPSTVRNFLQNFVLRHIEGYPTANLPAAIARLAKSPKRFKAMWDSTKNIATQDVARDSGKVLSRALKPFQDVYEGADRLAAVIMSEATGKAPREFMMNYGEIPRTLDFLRRSGIAPFISWQYFAVPSVARGLVDKPARARQVAAGLTRSQPDEEKRGDFVQLTNDREVKTGSLLPLNPADYGENGLLDPAQMPITQFLKGVSQTWSGEGRPWPRENQSTGNRLSDTILFLKDFFLPPAVSYFVPGLVQPAEQNPAKRAERDRLDYLLGLLGLPVRPIDADADQRKRYWEKRREYERIMKHRQREADNER